MNDLLQLNWVDAIWFRASIHVRSSNKTNEKNIYKQFNWFIRVDSFAITISSNKHKNCITLFTLIGHIVNLLCLDAVFFLTTFYVFLFAPFIFFIPLSQSLFFSWFTPYLFIQSVKCDRLWDWLFFLSVYQLLLLLSGLLLHTTKMSTQITKSSSIYHFTNISRTCFSW